MKRNYHKISRKLQFHVTSGARKKCRISLGRKNREECFLETFGIELSAPDMFSDKMCVFCLVLSVSNLGLAISSGRLNGDLMRKKKRRE